MILTENFKKRKKGMSHLLMLMVSVFLIVVFVGAMTIPLEKIGVQAQIYEVGRSAMLKLEADGGMTDKTKTLIEDKLKEKGLDVSLMKIECNKVVSPLNTTPTFGEDITLTITYDYKYNTKKIVGFNVSTGAEVINSIIFKDSCTSKN